MGRRWEGKGEEKEGEEVRRRRTREYDGEGGKEWVGEKEKVGVFLCWFGLYSRG